MTTSEEEAKKRFQKEAIPAFVELLEMAEEGIGEWRKRQGKEGGWEEVDVKDLMIAANTMIVMANAVALREAMAGGKATGPPQGAIIIGGLEGLEPGKVQADFDAQLRMRGIDPAVSSLVLAQLVSTENGLRMLRVMLEDAIRVREARGKARPARPPAELDMGEGDEKA